MNKKILVSLSVIAAVAAIVVGGTIAYFSDTETSTGNTFTAGTIDISLDPSVGQAVETVSGDLDLKPSQTGYTKAVVTNVGTNPAEIWKHIGNVKNRENGIGESEQEYYNEYPNSVNRKLSNWIHYDMEVYKSLGYSFTTTKDIEGTDYDLNVTVEDGNGWVIWTFDFPTEQWNGGGLINLGLMISRDGSHPDFQIHNNDGQCSAYPWGTWLYSPWGPTIDDGWYGWWTGDDTTEYNTPVSQLSWIQASGERDTDDDDSGVLIVKIRKCELGETFYWAAIPTVGSGFYSQDVSQGQIPVPDGVTWTNSATVDMSIPNYEAASISTLIKEIPETAGFYLTNNPQGDGGVESNWIYLGVLEPEESMCVIQSYHLDSTVDNWGQSDMVSFDVDFMAQQTEGTPPPEAPGPVLPGYGK